MTASLSPTRQAALPSTVGISPPRRSQNRDGRGLGDSLFEDSAEFGLRFRLTLDKHAEQSRELVERLSQAIGRDLAGHILDALQKDEADIYEQRQSSTTEDRLQTLDSLARNLLSLADNLVRVGLDVGRDGWA